jgi:hypothetical protein
MFGKDYSKRIASAGLQSDANMFASDFTATKATYFGIESNEVLYVGRKDQ